MIANRNWTLYAAVLVVLGFVGESLGSDDIVLPYASEAKVIELPMVTITHSIGPTTVISGRAVPEEDSCVVQPADEVVLTDEPIPPPPDLQWSGYLPTKTTASGNIAGRDMSMFSLESHGNLLGIDSRFAVHFLSGPTHTDMPPELYDFELAWRDRYELIGNAFVDIRATVGAYSDFEASARKGIRFPGHAIIYHDLDPALMTVAGVEILDRDDLFALPVVGVSWKPNDDWSLDLVFPRPRIQYRYSESYALYAVGELGGGTWAIERLSLMPDVVTYRDLRVMFGVFDLCEGESQFEIGYSFGRRLEYRSGVGDTELSDGILLQCRKAY